MIDASPPSAVEDKEVILKTIKPGDVTNFPKKGDVCDIQYEAFSEDEMRSTHPLGPIPFDSSGCHDQVLQFQLGEGNVIAGIEIVVSKMSLGQKVEAMIPYTLAYGDVLYHPIVHPRATLILRIELLRFSSSSE